MLKAMRSHKMDELKASSTVQESKNQNKLNHDNVRKLQADLSTKPTLAIIRNNLSQELGVVLLC